METEAGEQVMKNNSKDWRVRLFENLPYNADDTLLVNLPKKIDEKFSAQYNLSAEKVSKILDDVKGQIYVYATYLKPGKHQIIVYDKQKDKFWAKNIVVEMRKSEVITGK